MANASFTITGDKAIDRKLRALDPKLAKGAIRKGLRAGAKIVAARTKQLAPVGETGQVKRAIKVRASTRTRKKVVRFRVLIGKGDFTGEQFYGSFVEWGTKRSGKGGKKGAKGVRNTGQQAKRFMKRALDQTRPQATREAVDVIRRGVEQAAKG